MEDVAPEGFAGSLSRSRRRASDRFGDRALYGLTALAALATLLLIAAIVWKLVQGSWLSIRTYDIRFLWASAWDPVHNHFGALQFIIGTVVTSFGALLIAAPLSIAIALFLSQLAPAAVRGPIGTLVDMLAAVPSVVVGLWGIYVLAPLLAHHFEPFMHRWFGFIPLFGRPTESSIFAAIVVLTIMITPITTAICRELFLAVPRDVQAGAIALGATRWETIRGVTIPYVRSGISGGIILGFSRAVGEAIAVEQVVGNFIPIHLSIFYPGNTLASQIASEYQGAATPLALHSLIYLGLILLVITLITNVLAQRIVHRFNSLKV